MADGKNEADDNEIRTSSGMSVKRAWQTIPEHSTIT